MKKLILNLTAEQFAALVQLTNANPVLTQIIDDAAFKHRVRETFKAQRKKVVGTEIKTA